MLLNRNQIFKMVLKSLWRSPKDWEVDSHERKVMPWTSIYWITNEKLDIKIWVANGLPYFILEKSESMVRRSWGWFHNREKVKLNLLQTTLLHIVYLRKIRRYSYPLILLRYLIVGLISLGFITPMICCLENFRNKREIDLNISKKDHRNIILEEILN